MEQVLQLILTGLLIITVPGRGAAQLAEGHCSLVVELRGPDNRPVSEEVTVTEWDGRKTSLKAANGEARFCDLGIRPVTISVGDAGCSQVVVRTPVDWEETKTVRIVYDELPCSQETPPLPTCKLLFRLLDEGGRPVLGAAVRFSAGRPGSRDYVADKFGRILINLPFGERLTGFVTVPGFRSKQVDIPCSPENRRSERKLVLEK
jgi:hypothetical protein